MLGILVRGRIHSDNFLRARAIAAACAIDPPSRIGIDRAGTIIGISNIKRLFDSITPPIAMMGDSSAKK